jgi:lysophospholipase L1-like esterase
MAQKSFIVSFILVILITAVSFLEYKNLHFASRAQMVVSPNATTPHPSVDDTFRTYTAPKLPSKSEYTIVMVGDSMTYALGPHGGTFNEFINQKYKPQKIGIVVDNYAAGSTNVLSLPKAMTTKTTYWDSTFAPLLSRKFDLILIESFGYNPLSQFPREEGLKKNNEMLDETMKTLMKTHPQARVAFVATIAPNKQKYALPENSKTTLAERTDQVNEREAFIKNHIAYAKAHNIPIINIYEKSFNKDGDGNLEYINPDDYIHPSAVGVDFIGHELANAIYDNQIIPHK